MKIIVLNCGSSSIKYQLVDMPAKDVVAKGVVEKIGLKGSFIKHSKTGDEQVKLEGEILDHQQGIEYLLGILTSEKHGSIEKLEEIDAVGHRVVHGAEEFSGSVLITDEVVGALERSSELAPLHNPPNLKGIYAMQALLPKVKQVGVFDTAFHQTMPEHVFLYAIPYVLYEKYKIRRYGFHGTSHKFVSARGCEILNIDINKQKIITCHLGNGSSVAAIKNGKSYDTSMGMTPLEGLVMGTRSGDVDPALPFFLADHLKMTLDEIDEIRPVLEWGLRWAELNLPAAPEITLVHQDFRSGNYMIDNEGLNGILDWEFAAWGDPMSDLGWFCAECWRFNHPELEAGGISSRRAFYEGYEVGSGISVDKTAVFFWEFIAHIRAKSKISYL